MELFTSVGDVIIFIAAIIGAITAIWKFFANGGRFFKKKVDTARSEQLAQEEQRTRNTFESMWAEKKKDREGEIETVLKRILPDILLAHDLETRDKYRADRERYLTEIKGAVVAEVKSQLNAIDSMESDLTVLAESARDVLREKIMAIYHKNKKTRKMEEHEKEALVQYYKDYKAINGNSYIDKYYGRMSTWEVIPDDYEEE